MITETAIKIDLNHLLSKTGCRDASRSLAYLQMLAETFPNGRALLVDHDGDVFLATEAGDYFDDAPPAYAYQIMN
jgi:hypothetical protein